MPIEFACGNCGKRLRAQESSAGKRVRCAGCQTILQVPGKSPVPRPGAAAASPPPPSSGQWYVKAEDDQTYGPVSKQELDQWVGEGRVTADTQILMEGAAQWQWATDVYPQLTATTPAAAKPGGQPNPFDFGEAETKANPFDFAAADTSPTARVAGGRSGGYRSGGGKYGHRRPQSGAVTAVAVVNFVLGTIQLLCGGMIVVGGDAITRMFSGAASNMSGNEAQAVEAFGTIAGGVIVAIGVTMVLFAAFVLMAGFGVVQRAQWGRIMTLILGGISGVFALLNLGMVMMGSPANIVGVAVQGGYCALVFCVLLNRQYAAEFR